MIKLKNFPGLNPAAIYQASVKWNHNALTNGDMRLAVQHGRLVVGRCCFDTFTTYYLGFLKRVETRCKASGNAVTEYVIQELSLDGYITDEITVDECRYITDYAPTVIAKPDGVEFISGKLIGFNIVTKKFLCRYYHDDICESVEADNNEIQIINENTMEGFTELVDTPE